MITKQQEKLMNLVSEIDKVCKSSNIPYLLHGRTAGYVSRRDEFKTAGGEFHIMVKASDMVKLQKALLKAKRESREIEDLTNNPHLPTCYFRYVDSSTTLIDSENPVELTRLGTAVTVHPVFTDEIDKKTASLLIGHNINYNGVCATPMYRSEKQQRDSLKAKKTESMMGSRLLARKLWSIIKKSRDNEEDSYRIFDMNGNLKKITKDLFNDPVYKRFENIELPLPGDNTRYFRTMFGRDWNDHYRKTFPSTQRITVIEDSERGYREYLNQWKRDGMNYTKFLKENADYMRWYQNEFVYWEEVTEKEFSMAECTGARIDMYYLYQDRMDALRKADQENDLEQLAALMQEYLDTTDQFLKEKGIGFYINEELFTYASHVWEKKKRKGYAEQVLGLVPPSYRDDIGSFLDDAIRRYQNKS